MLGFRATSLGVNHLKANMVSVSIKHNMDALLKDIQEEQKRIRISAAIALTKTAKAAQVELVSEMGKVFDRPVRYTLNGTYVRPATTSRLQSEVGIKDQSYAGKGTAAINYLSPQIYGGGRGLKRFEKALQAFGILPKGMFAVPGSAAKLDANGNMSAGQIVQILSALGAAERFSGYMANRTRRSAKRKGSKLVNYMAGRPGGGRLPLGVWQVTRFARGSAVKPVLIFTKAPQYKVRYPFQSIVQKVVDRDFDAFFQQQLNIKK